MPLDVPFRLGPFIVDTNGRLEASDPDRFPNFHLAWRGCPVHARLDPGSSDLGEAAHLVLSAVLGRVPSTAGGDAGHNRQRRTATFGALRELVGGSGNAGRLLLLADHRVVMEASRPVDLPVSAGGLVSQITCFLLDLGPYLDLLAEADVPVEAVGVALSSEGGTVKI